MSARNRFRTTGRANHEPATAHPLSAVSVPGPAPRRPHCSVYPHLATTATLRSRNNRCRVIRIAARLRGRPLTCTPLCTDLASPAVSGYRRCGQLDGMPCDRWWRVWFSHCQSNVRGTDDDRHRAHPRRGPRAGPPPRPRSDHRPASHPAADRRGHRALRGAGADLVAAAADRPRRRPPATSSTRWPDSVRCNASSTTPRSRRSGSTSPAGCSSPGTAAPS